MGRHKIVKGLDDILRDDFNYNPNTGGVFRLGKPWGCLDSHGYLVGTVKRKCVKVHRVAWFLHYGKWPTYGLDHINRVKDDNSVSNLRDVPQSVNVCNVGLRGDNKSGFKNVSWDSNRGVWVLRKNLGGVYKFLGYFNCPTSAHFENIRLSSMERNTDEHSTDGRRLPLHS